MWVWKELGYKNFIWDWKIDRIPVGYEENERWDTWALLPMDIKLKNDMWYPNELCDKWYQGCFMISNVFFDMKMKYVCRDTNSCFLLPNDSVITPLQCCRDIK